MRYKRQRPKSTKAKLIHLIRNVVTMLNARLLTYHIVRNNIETYFFYHLRLLALINKLKHKQNISKAQLLVAYIILLLLS
jgi:hypothetical protein